MLYLHLAPLLNTEDLLVQRYPVNGLSKSICVLPCYLSQTFDRFFRVSGLLVAVYSHNLVAIINCDYPSWTCEPLLPGCQEPRLIESQVSINYQGVLVADNICSVLACHHPLPSYPCPPQPSSRADWSGGRMRQKAQN